jgi:hypothetical protein
MTHCEPSETSAVNVSTYRGDTVRLSVELTDAGGSPVDGSAWTWLAQVRDSADAVVADWVVDTTDAAIGVLQLSLPDDVTAAMPVADFAWDLQAEDEASETRTLLAGQLRVKSDVSRTVT